MDNPPTTATTSGAPEAFDDRVDYRLEFWRGVADMFGVSDSAVDEALVESSRSPFSTCCCRVGPLRSAAR